MFDTRAPETQQLLEQLARQMIDSGLRLATAESCTGGMLAHWVTTLAGSSSWFECGFVTYSDESKIGILGIQPETLDRYGAVSTQVAEQMVQGALRNSTADIAVSITGIAGPSGGSAVKPTGTVYISTARRDQLPSTTHHLFDGDRTAVREQCAIQALTLLMGWCKE